MMQRVKEGPLALPSRIPGEHCIMKATAKALVSNREGEKERKWVERRKKYFQCR